MPTYTVNGKSYNIPEDQVNDFLAAAQEDGLEVTESAPDFQPAAAEETAPAVAEPQAVSYTHLTLPTKA